MKKLIFKSLLLFVGILFGMNTHAQTVYTGNASSPTTCDGYAYFIDSLGGYETFAWADSVDVVFSDSALVTGLCPGIYTITCTNANGGDTTITVVIGSGPSTQPCPGFYAYFSNVQLATWGVCDGSLTVAAQGGTAPYSYSWNNGVTSTGNTASNLCPDAYYVNVVDANGCASGVSASVIDSLNNPCNNFAVSVASNDVSGPNLCDGSVNASASGGAAPYFYSWSNGATTAGLNGLCPGTYQVTVTDSIGCTTSGWGSVYSSGVIVDSSLVVTATSTSVSEDGECDGTISASAWGVSGSYVYVLSSGATNSTGYFDSLCQGIYTVTVFDSQGDTIYVDVIVSNPGNTYNNGTYGDSLFVDSILADLQQDCSLNYQTIDSVYIDGYTYAGDSIIVYWNVVSSSGTSVITQSYYIGGPAGVYSLGIQVYCPMKSIGNYFTATDQIYYTNSPLGLGEQTMAEVNIYPNPVSDVMHIQLGEAGHYDAVLYDVTGRMIITQQVINSNHMQMDVSTLSRGQYTLVISGDKGTVSKSVVK